jgi:hypothetical protein
VNKNQQGIAYRIVGDSGSDDENHFYRQASLSQAVEAPVHSQEDASVMRIGRTQISMLENKCGMSFGDRATVIGESGGGHTMWLLSNGRGVLKRKAGITYMLIIGSGEEVEAPMSSLQGDECRSSSNSEQCIKCKYTPDRTTLMVLVCENCGKRFQLRNKLLRKGGCKSISFYNQIRRQLRTEQQLVSATVPLDRDSARFVHEIIVQLGLSNNTAMPHVTFVEGLNSPPPTKELNALYLAMKEDPRLTIVKSNCVPTRRDKGMELVCLELQIYSATLELATHSLAAHDCCQLPQWPLHLALGVAAIAQAREAANTLCQTYQGKVICVAAEQFRVLSAPTPHPDPHHHHHNFVAEETDHVLSDPTPHPAPHHQKIVAKDVFLATAPYPDLHQNILAEEVLSSTTAPPPPQKIRAIATAKRKPRTTNRDIVYAQFLQSLRTPVPPTNFRYQRSYQRTDDSSVVVPQNIHTRGRKRKSYGSGSTAVVLNPLLEGRWSPSIVEVNPDLTKI